MNKAGLFLFLVFLAVGSQAFGDSPFPGGCVGGRGYSERTSTFRKSVFMLKGITRNGKPLTDTTVKMDMRLNYVVPITEFDSLITINLYPDSSLRTISNFMLLDTVHQRVNIRFFKD